MRGSLRGVDCHWHADAGSPSQRECVSKLEAAVPRARWGGGAIVCPVTRVHLAELW